MSMELSVACILGYDFASVETVEGRHELIIPELFFAGLTKLQDINDETLVREIIKPPYIPAFLLECNATLNYFEQREIDIRAIRRAIRQRLGTGTYNRQKGEKISRSQTTRDAFTSAENMAQSRQQPIITINLLMAAMIEVPGTILRDLLLELNIDWQDLCNDLIEIDINTDIETRGNSLSQNSLTNEPKKPTTASNFLSQISQDLTQMAREGKLHMAVERDKEINQILTALSRARMPNALLVGEAGVGKTAIIEGIAYLIATGRLDHLHIGNCRIVQIEAATLVGGTTYRGAFEDRMNKIIQEASSDAKLILFIDEIHMLFGAGGSSGTMDAAQIFKTALDRDQMRLIGATTEAEYRRHIATDPAFMRRFAVVNISEPNEKATRQILEFSRKQLEAHHQVVISDEAIDAAIKLSVQYIHDRHLPDKAYSLLDSASTTVGLGKLYDSTTLDAIQDFIDTSATKIVTARHIREAMPTTVDISQGISPREILKMADNLNRMVIGQPQAAEAIAEIVVQNASQLSNRGAMGVLLFIGPSGVGKTEMARATAELLFGSPDHMIRIDMGEYIEKHSVSRLLGSPPGYIGSEQGGQLTNELLKKPRSVVLLDEIEKAHRDILQIFLAAFDNGRMTDSRGQIVDTSRAFFIMTSNLGVQAGLPFDPEMVKVSLESRMTPEFVNRIDNIVFFKPLEPSHMLDIVRIHIERLRKDLFEKGISMNVEPSVLDYLADKGYDRNLGARPLLRLMRSAVLTPVSRKILYDELGKGAVINILLSSEQTIYVTSKVSKETDPS